MRGDICVQLGVSCLLMVCLVPSVRSEELNLPDLVARVEPAVVTIKVQQNSGESSGSGFVIDGGWIVTNYHVVDRAASAEVLFPDKTTAKVLGVRAFATENDLAILEIESPKKRPGLKLLEAPPRKGESVVAFGSPMGFGFTASQGIVSGVRMGDEIKKILDSEYDSATDMTWIQTTAAISSGNSGGPLVDMNGNVVGVNSWTYKSAQNLNFSVSALHVQKLTNGIDATELKPFTELPKSTSKDAVGTKTKAQLAYDIFAKEHFEKQIVKARDSLQKEANELQSVLWGMESSKESIQRNEAEFEEAVNLVRNLSDFDPGIPAFLKEDGAAVGKPGTWYVFQVIGKDSLLISHDSNLDTIYCVKDVSTIGIVDRSTHDFDGIWYTLGETYSYGTAAGGSRTIYLFREFPLEISAALDNFKKSHVEPAINATLASIKKPRTPSAEELSDLERKRKEYRDELERAKKEHEEVLEQNERAKLEQRASARLKLAKDRSATQPELAKKLLQKVMNEFSTTQSASEAEEIASNGAKDRFRVWHSGRHSTEAVLVGVNGDLVVLKRPNGQVVKVSFSKIHKSDQNFVVAEMRKRGVSRLPVTNQ